MIDAALARSWLFVPGDRPDRFDTRHTRRADAVILDLEDAVAPEDKEDARVAVGNFLATDRGWVRINGADTDAHGDDLTAILGRPGLAGVVLPKAESPAVVTDVASRTRGPVIALIESAAGVERAGDIAAAALRLALGPVDLMTALGVIDQDALHFARSRLVMAAAAAGAPGPIDGPTTDLDDPHVLAADLHRARSLGFTGALCLHPRQLEAVHTVHTPAPDAVDHARRLVAAAEAAGGGTGKAVRVAGQMVDAPALAAARALLCRAEALGARHTTEENSCPPR